VNASEKVVTECSLAREVVAAYALAKLSAPVKF
jgi:hypothetical protein